ncbi:MAG TPA: SDR family NAD(P)-dependent oxidoreductase [Gammaproteobacteria bacterium]|nr:SDR family NAD(P)-dependent oxidoreductase [Gammaproteobacteria bacterium]
MTRNILILGATSGIARGIANAFAKKGDNLFLAGRDESELNKIAQDLKIRFNITAETLKFDIEKDQPIKIDNLDGVVFSIGYDGPEIEKVLAINFTQAVHALNYYAEYFKNKKQGFIIGLSSVAGDRGRQSNFMYGSAKAGFSAYLQGLRNTLFNHNVSVITIKPGFVDTVQTFGKPGLFLVADPNVIGEKIANAVDKKSDVLYLPWFWKYIMCVIKSIPECMFKRLSL